MITSFLGPLFSRTLLFVAVLSPLFCVLMVCKEARLVLFMTDRLHVPQSPPPLMASNV